MVRSALQMQGWHALALLFCGVMGATRRLAGGCRRRGLRSGPAAVLRRGRYAGDGGVSLGVLAPIGGTLLMLGWALLLASALRAR